jgi:hypothetical protein
MSNFSRNFSRKMIVSIICATILATLGNAAEPGSYVIRHVRVIDGTGKPSQPNMAVYIRSGRIVSVQPDDGNREGIPGTITIEGTGKFLIPGLWDAHVHLSDIGEVAIPLLPTYGITSVRDMGGDPEFVRDLRDRIAKGDLIGPRVKFCGPMLEGKWDQQPGKRTDHWVVTTPADAKAIVDKLANEGVDCIKVRTYASRETYFALASAAKEHGLIFGGHAPWGIDPIEASNAGQRSFEHAFYPWPWETITTQKKEKIEDTFRTNGSLVVPTLIAWETFRFDLKTIESVVTDYAGKSDPRLALAPTAAGQDAASRITTESMSDFTTPFWNRSNRPPPSSVATLP